MEELDSIGDWQSDSPFAQVQTPRLSILHLLLWTLCSAVHLSLTRAVNAFRGDMPGGYAAIQDASNVLQGIIAGAIFMGAIVLVSTRVRGGRPMLRQPGHWLLIVPALFFLIYLPVSLTHLLLRNVDFGGTSFLVLFGMIYLLPSVAYGFAARHNRVLRWRLVFVAMTFLVLTQGVYTAGIGLSYYGLLGSWLRALLTVSSSGRLLLAAVVLAVSLFDVVAGRRYDWLHWTGVAAFVTSSSMTLMWMMRAWLVD